MEVIESVAKIRETPSQEGQHIAVSVWAQELQEESAHALVEFVGITAHHVESLFGQSSKELLRVDLIPP